MEKLIDLVFNLIDFMIDSSNNNKEKSIIIEKLETNKVEEIDPKTLDQVSLAIYNKKKNIDGMDVIERKVNINKNNNYNVFTDYL